MPTSTFAELPKEEPAQIRIALRRARYGDLLALHIALWCANGRTLTAIAAVLFWACSSVVPHGASRPRGDLGPGARAQSQFVAPVCTTVLLPTLRRSLVALLKAPPGAYGWYRTRWSCVILAATL
jgi:hypothetical protein